MQPTRRDFLIGGAALLGGLALPAGLVRARGLGADDRPFEISLAEWSLHRTIFDGDLDHLDFARTAREQFGLDAVEYVSQFFPDKADDRKYLLEMKRRAEDAGVRSLLIMVDREGDLGHRWAGKRRRAVEDHLKWLDAARLLGCHSIRVNATSSGSFQEQLGRAAEGLRALVEAADQRKIDVIVENHGGLSSNGHWLRALIRRVDHPRCGTLPDFGNFHQGEGRWYDRYVGVRQLMPFARGVSAKSHEFDDAGEETGTDYERMLRIVVGSGYRGHVGIEFEGKKLDEREGIRRTKALLERVRDRIAADRAVRSESRHYHQRGEPQRGKRK
jgi:sugar phosphate isomerase/epimerase